MLELEAPRRDRDRVTARVVDRDPGQLRVDAHDRPRHRKSGIEKDMPVVAPRRRRRPRDRVVARRREGPRAHRSRVGDRGAHRPSTRSPGSRRAACGSDELVGRRLRRRRERAQGRRRRHRRTSPTACSRPTSRSARSRASTSSRPGSGSTVRIKPVRRLRRSSSSSTVLRWVPGEGPVVADRRPRPRRPRPPASSTTTSTTTTHDDGAADARPPRRRACSCVTRAAAGRAVPAPAHRRTRSRSRAARRGRGRVRPRARGGRARRLPRRPRLRPLPRDAARSHGARVRAHRVRGRRAPGRRAADPEVVHAGDRRRERARRAGCSSSASGCSPASTPCTATRRS